MCVAVEQCTQQHEQMCNFGDSAGEDAGSFNVCGIPPKEKLNHATSSAESAKEKQT